MKNPREQGFALAETLVALAIVGTMLAMTFRLIGSNALQVRQVEDRAVATLVARSALDYAVAIGRVGDGPLSGTSAGYRWEASVGPYAGDGRRQSRLRRVSVTVRGTGGKVAARLSTVMAP
ncbi:MAG TPA: type II secretion system protein [Sphingomonas sp.]|nr:type II secretion system protein [Sphingomonas sp.]